MTDEFTPKPKVAKPVRERTVERAFVDHVKTFGSMAVKLTSPGFNGLPDRLVLQPGGRASFVELKAPGKHPTPQQMRVHQTLRGLGFDVSVIDTVAGARAWQPTNQE